MVKSQLPFSKSLILPLVMMFGFSYNAMAESALDGNWQTGEDNSVVQVEEADGVVSGKLISSDNPKATMGKEILSNFKQVKGVWTGKLYAAKKGKWYDAIITPSADSLNIKVSAGIMSKKVVWKRAK